MKTRYITPFVLLGVFSLAGCGRSSDSLVEPGASLACKGVSFNATIANSDGAATLRRVLVTSDGDPYTYTFVPPAGTSAVASVGMTVTFRYATVGTHPVRVVVADETSSPSPYRVSGDYSQLLTCVTATSAGFISAPLETRTAALANGDAISYEFTF